MALVTALWWIAAIMALLLLAFQWVRHEARIEHRIAMAADQQYAAEGVLAREIQRIKARPWSFRWYQDAADPSVSRIHGQSISGEFGGCTYRGHVQDAADIWGGPGGRLPSTTDFFLRVATPEQSETCFFWRVVFRIPSPGRPRGFAVRRFARLPLFDPADEGARRAVLVGIHRDEQARERNRGASEVLAREIGASLRAKGSMAPVAQWLETIYPLRETPRGFLVPAAHAGITDDELSREARRTAGDGLERVIRTRGEQGLDAGEIAEYLVGSSTIEEQIVIENRIQAALKSGLSAVRDPTPGARSLQQSVEILSPTLGLAESLDDANRAVSLPRCLYAIARSTWLLARTLPMGTKERTDLLVSADEALSRVITGFPWDIRHNASRFEAPHAHFLRAQMRLSAVPGFSVEPLREAMELVRADLVRLRHEYPGFHLWGDGIPVDAPGSEYLEGLISPSALVMAGIRAPPSRSGADDTSTRWPSASVLRWVPWPAPGGSWVDGGTLQVPRSGARVALLEPLLGAIPDGLVAVMGGDYPIHEGLPPGQACEIFDPMTRTSRRIAGGLLRPRRDFEMVRLADGTFLITGGLDSAGSPLAECEIFDPRAETFTAIPPMNHPRAGHHAVLTGGSTVLVLGGEGELQGSTGEVIDVTAADATWTMVSNVMSFPRVDPVIAPTAGGFLIAGGQPRRGQGPQSTAELFLPTLSLFYPGKRNGDFLVTVDGTVLPTSVFGASPPPMGIMTSPRADTWSLMVGEGPEAGKVLLGPHEEDKNTELYDPTTRQFKRGPALSGGATGRDLIWLPDGGVLLTGGEQPPSEILARDLASTEVAPMPGGRRGASAIRSY